MITILTGPNSYALRAALHERLAAFVTDNDEMGVERLDGEDASFERIQEALQSLTFLIPHKLVVLQAPGANKQFTEKAEGLLKDLPETTDLLIVEPKLDKRLAYYKFLKKQPGFKEFPELDGLSLAKWLVTESKACGAALKLDDARYLIERVGANQQNLASEIEKLTINHAQISRTDINNLTVATPQSTIFQLLEAAFAGNTKQALALYAEQRALKVEPQQLIAMLAWQLHILALIKAAGPERGPDMIAKEAKVSPYVVKKSAGIARTLSLSRIRELVADLTTIDERLKQESLDGDEVMMGYLVGLSLE